MKKYIYIINNYYIFLYNPDIKYNSFLILFSNCICQLYFKILSIINVDNSQKTGLFVTAWVIF